MFQINVLLRVFGLLILILECQIVVSVSININKTVESKLTHKTIEEILSEFRELMKNVNVIGGPPLQAYIIPSVDAHQSEYVSRRDRRLSFISGFTGSAGVAAVTASEAALWTDSRYYIQAEEQINHDFWELMKSGLPETPTLSEWLTTTLPENSRVGIDPFLMDHAEYSSLSNSLQSSGHTLVSVRENLVDMIWTTRPDLKLPEIVMLDIKFSGRTSEEKLADLRADIQELNGDSHVITALDEIAWLLNLRGSDIEYNPVFFSYVIVSMKEVQLFIMEEERITPAIHKFFLEEGINVIVKDYGMLSNGIIEVLNATEKAMILSRPSQAIYSIVPSKRRKTVNENPVNLRKVIKNTVEAEGMRNAHIRDGVALVKYLQWLEMNVDNGNVTELSGAKQLMEFRSQQENFRGLSFTAISAFGSHAAMAHYSPTDETDRLITRDEIYLIDSGGQYWDGTTDVTRTIHLGQPNDEEKEAFTRVLKGFISLNGAKFPPGAPFSFFDALARKSLWDVGLNYGHGTGHGVGAYLCVHEYPPSIGSRNTYYGMMTNMFTSNEPGYYLDGSFGIRIEDVIQVVETNRTIGDFDGQGVLEFYDITMAPIQQKLIKIDLLTESELTWLNGFHKRIRDTIGPRLNNNATFAWLIEQTKPILIHSNSQF